MGVDLDAMRAERAARLDAELARLVSELRAMGATLIVQVRREQCERWSALDGHYVSTRYPDALPGGLPARAYDRRAVEDAVNAPAEAVDTARRIVRG